MAGGCIRPRQGRRSAYSTRIVAGHAAGPGGAACRPCRRAAAYSATSSLIRSPLLFHA